MAAWCVTRKAECFNAARRDPQHARGPAPCRARPTAQHARADGRRGCLTFRVGDLSTSDGPAPRSLRLRQPCGRQIRSVALDSDVGKHNDRWPASLGLRQIAAPLPSRPVTATKIAAGIRVQHRLAGLSHLVGIEAFAEEGISATYDGGCSRAIPVMGRPGDRPSCGLRRLINEPRSMHM